MAELQGYPIVTSSGSKGQVFRESRFLDRSESFRVVMEDGSEFRAPSSAIQVRPDGTFLLDEEILTAPPRNGGGRPAPAPEAVPEPAEPTTNPAKARAARLERHPAPEPSPARPSRSDPAPAAAAASAPAASASALDQALFTDEVTVERVAVNRILDGPIEPRTEGDTTVIPVLEEVLTVQKRLLLREEVRITRRRTEIREPRPMVLGSGEHRVIGSDGRTIDLKTER